MRMMRGEIIRVLSYMCELKISALPLPVMKC